MLPSPAIPTRAPIWSSRAGPPGHHQQARPHPAGQRLLRRAAAERSSAHPCRREQEARPGKARHQFPRPPEHRPRRCHSTLPRTVLGPDGNLIPAPPPEQVDMGAIVIKIDPPLTNIRLADVLDAIVKVADRPIKYSIEDYAIVFSPEDARSHLRSTFAPSRLIRTRCLKACTSTTQAASSEPDRAAAAVVDSLARVACQGRRGLGSGEESGEGSLLQRPPGHAHSSSDAAGPGHHRGS